MEGEYTAFWYQSNPKQSYCSNVMCKTSIPQGVPIVVHTHNKLGVINNPLNIDHGCDIGCIECGKKYPDQWAGPFPTKWDSIGWGVAVKASKEVKDMSTTPTGLTKPLRTIILTSFGYKYGKPDIPYNTRLYDLRKLVRNPWEEPSLRKLTGLDGRVQDYIKYCKRTKTILYIAKTGDIYSNQTFIYVGCQSGKHRSVALVELLARVYAQRFSSDEAEIKIIHRDIDRKPEPKPVSNESSTESQLNA